MFTQFSEISARFIQVDKSKGVKRLLFLSQYIEHKISTFNEIFNRMKEQKNLSYSLRKVTHPIKSSLNSMFLPILSLPGAFAVQTTDFGAKVHNFRVTAKRRGKKCHSQGNWYESFYDNARA